jgi:hypothetical protein
MSNQNNSGSEQSRNIALSILERSKNEPALVERFKEDPCETLKSLGLADDAISDFLGDSGLDPEVSGYTYFPDCLLTRYDSCSFTRLVD